LAGYWFILKIIISFFYKILGVGLKNAQVVLGIELEIKLISTHIYSTLMFFNKHSLCQFKVVSDIVCYDSVNRFFRFCIVYNILSVRFNLGIRIFSKLNELTTILSVSGLFKATNWIEREIFDFFGIFFFLNNDLRRILTDYGFKGYPLRKDFPLTGFIEIYYDDSKKKISFIDL
jgi:NADH:ubiquinone oxidoreductase subunit C